MSDEAEIEKPSAPAVHGDELWDGPRLVRNIGPKPQHIETKKEYWDALKKSGFRMLDQAESAVPSDAVREPDPLPVELTPAPVPQHFSQGECHLFMAADAVFRARNCVMWFTCLECFQRKVNEWCNVLVDKRIFGIECNCGKREYKPPVGTTDNVGMGIPTLALKAEAPSLGFVTTMGGRTKPVAATTFSDTEALILRAFYKVCRQRMLEPHVFHQPCFMGDPSNVDNELAVLVSHEEVAFGCPCQVAYWRKNHVGTPMSAAPTLTM